jgi:hypothetical protein
VQIPYAILGLRRQAREDRREERFGGICLDTHPFCKTI